MNLDQLSGLGQKRKEKLGILGIRSIKDLMMHMPSRYEWIESDLAEFHHNPGNIFHIEVFIKSVQQKPKYLLYEGYADQKRISILFFHQNYRRQTIRPNGSYFFVGRLKEWKGRLQMVNPTLAKSAAAEGRTYLPVYPLTKGITQPMLRGWIGEALKSHRLPNNENPVAFPDLITSEEALRQMHFPGSPEDFEMARKRLAADEIVRYQLAQRLTSERDRAGYAQPLSDLSPYLERLPFQLTEGQMTSLDEIRRDMASNRAMYRLLQGDVGSGKTVIAFLAMATAMEAGNQTAYLAPTEVLAKQVHEKAQAFFSDFGIPCALLTGATKKRERQAIMDRLKAGQTMALIGTHALFSDKLVFSRLHLIVTDEQHRFGVAQRATLHGKGRTADVLAMSATPIPRTLALTVYGEMDISTIQTRPEGRKPIKTYLIGPDKRRDAYEFMAREVGNDRRGFVICPLIEEGEEMENAPKSIEAVDQELTESLMPKTPHAILHGRMKKVEQDDVFQSFVSGRTPVLLSTTVVEVGIDVPKATVIFIESAERFGLAQLHQLRGRVGRSDRQSYCILICHSRSKKSIERMRVLVESQDGFEIAERDLALRGQGNLFGFEQHGSFGFRFFDLAMDRELWEQVDKELRSMDSAILASHAHFAREYLNNVKEVRNPVCE